MVIEAVEQGNPQIPFDLFVKKKCKGLLNITNPFKSPIYLSDRRRHNRVLIDPSGVTLISIHRSPVRFLLSAWWFSETLGFAIFRLIKVSAFLFVGWIVAWI